MIRIVRFLAPWLATAAVFALAPLVFRSGFALTTMSLIGINVIFALSYNILLGQTGLLSFGHAVYFGLGAFIAIHTLNAAVEANLGLPLPAFVLVGGLGGLVFGYLFGLVVSRRGGLVFSMITLGIGELVSSSSFILRSFFGGEEGIVTNRTGAAAFFGLQVRHPDTDLLSHRRLVFHRDRRGLCADADAARAYLERGA